MSEKLNLSLVYKHRTYYPTPMASSLYNKSINLIHTFTQTFYVSAKKAWMILFSITFLLTATQFAGAQSNWELVWAEEFDTDTLDMGNWEYQIGTGASEGLFSWGNNERQYYTDREENIYLEDNKLHIRALDGDFANRSYTSARIRTKDKADFKYGKFEIRAKVPEGQGMWPAIWMMPTESVYGTWPKSGEIDIMELVGHIPNVVHGTVHYGPDWPNNLEHGGSITKSDGNYSDDFHVYSIIWKPDQIDWFVDGQLYARTTPSHLAPHNWPFDQYFHFILNVAVGGNWPGDPDETTEFPQEMIVDYVRVYEDATLTSSEEDLTLPSNIALNQNYPNPFNPSTEISFELPSQSDVRVEVYDMMGRRVATAANGTYPAGTHSVTFDASNLSSGTYIYRLITDSFQQSRSMVLIK